MTCTTHHDSIKTIRHYCSETERMTLLPFATRLNASLVLTNISESSKQIGACDYSLEITFMVLNSIAGVIILPGNLLVFLVILSNSRLRQQQMNVFLGSLALADIIMGACVVPGYSLFCVGCSTYPLSKYCWFFRGPKDVAIAASIYSVLAICYDRCLAVYWPLYYVVHTSKRKMIAIFCTIWGLSLLIALIRNFWQHTTSGAEFGRIDGLYNMVLLVAVLFVPLVAVSVVNVAMIFTIRKQTIQVSLSRSSHDEVDDKEERQKGRERRKGTIACLLVMTVFVLLWIPRISFNIQYLIKGQLALVDELLLKVSIFFLALQSSFNPFIYSLYRAEFRQAAVKLLKCNRQ